MGGEQLERFGVRLNPPSGDKAICFAHLRQQDVQHLGGDDHRFLQVPPHRIGPGKLLEDGKRSPMDVQKGDRILIGKYSGSEIKIDGNEYLIMREDEVLGVLTGSAASA